MHNHPSGDPFPSEADLRLTRRILEASRILLIQLVDHVIIGASAPGRSSYFSFKEAERYWMTPFFKDEDNGSTELAEVLPRYSLARRREDKSKRFCRLTSLAWSIRGSLLNVSCLRALACQPGLKPAES